MVIIQYTNPFQTEEELRQLKFNEISNAKKLTLDMTDETSKYTKLKDLAFINEVETVKHIISTTSFTIFCNEARNWLSMLEKCKIDKRKNYEEKDSFECLVSKLKDLFKVDLEIIKITQVGLEGYSWNIEFLYNTITYCFTIPVIEKMNTKTYKYMNEGKYYLGYMKTESYIESIKSSYLEEEIQSAFIEFSSKVVS